MDFVADNLDWNGKAGQRLDEFARRLPAQPRVEVTIFGSVPLQLFVDRGFLSEDIDLFGNEDTTDFLTQFVETNHWGKGQTDCYIQVCDPLAFKSTIDWRSPPPGYAGILSIEETVTAEDVKAIALEKPVVSTPPAVVKPAGVPAPMKEEKVPAAFPERIDPLA